MKITHVTPGLIPIPPNGWGAVEKIIWEYHCNLKEMGENTSIEYLNDVDPAADIVHIHVANLCIEAKERGIKYIFTLHDHHAYVYGRDSEVYKQNLEAIEGSIVTLVPARFLVAYFQYHPKVKYFEHAVNTDYFKPADKQPEEHRLLCVANNGFANDQGFDRKGFSYAIQAAQNLQIPITIVGPSNNKNFFERFLTKYDKLTLIYDADEEELRKMYQTHTIFLHPSILEAGHPNLTLLEAMACGLPVIATFEPHTKLPGLCRIERDIKQIMDVILFVKANYDHIRETAIESATNQSYKHITTKLLNLYQEILKRQSNMKYQLIDVYETTDITIKTPILTPQKTNQIHISFINGAKVEIVGEVSKKYRVDFINTDTGIIEYTSDISTNCWCKTSKEYFVNWHIKVYGDEILVAEHKFDPTGQQIYIALDSSALGDTIAWFPILDEFRKKWDCKLIVSTFHNDWFAAEYLEITFATPGMPVDNLYAMYTVGWYYNEDGSVTSNKSPIDFKLKPLQETATAILGLEPVEVRPRMVVDQKETTIKDRYVVIAPHASAHAKYWNNPGGWQIVIDHINSLGYKVVMLTQEPLGDEWHDSKLGGKLQNVIDKTGNHPLQSRMTDILNSELFIGVGSGLSWLSWALGTKTIMISGFSYPYTEMSDCIRISTNKPNTCSGCFNRHKLDAGDWEWCPDHKNTTRMFECTKSIKPEEVIAAINQTLL